MPAVTVRWDNPILLAWQEVCYLMKLRNWFFNPSFYWGKFFLTLIREQPHGEERKGEEVILSICKRLHTAFAFMDGRYQSNW